ncbi:MAG: glycosyltransferase family 4 protein [Chryseolinea sp.]
MKVIFYTATSYLDISLEVINTLKKRVELYVLIEITTGSKKNNIIDVEDLPIDRALVQPEEIMDQNAYKVIKPYFEGTAAVHFVVHARKSLISTISISWQVFNYVRKLRPDVFHLEAIMARAVGIIPAMLYCKRSIITVHDPVPHSGGKDWKQTIVNFLFYHLPMKQRFFFYSQFALSLFKERNPNSRAVNHLVQMGAYSYFRKLLKSDSGHRKHVLFFGRLSPYKGLDVLLNAWPQVSKVYPELQLIIAGRCYKGYELSNNLVKLNKGHITIMDSYIENEVLTRLINEAKFIICPYTDATQSGVIMTGFALNKPVVATNVGAFPEYVRHGANGWLVVPDNPRALANTILGALKKNAYQVCEKNIQSDNEQNAWDLNLPIFLNAYSS